MTHNERDSVIRTKILNEIADIEAFTNGLNEESFAASKIAQKAVVMSMINIGELSKAFSDDYIAATNSIPWKAIRGLRNIAAHHYEAIRISNIWVTVCNDIPFLRKTLENTPA